MEKTESLKERSKWNGSNFWTLKCFLSGVMLILLVFLLLSLRRGVFLGRGFMISDEKNVTLNISKLSLPIGTIRGFNFVEMNKSTAYHQAEEESNLALIYWEEWKRIEWSKPWQRYLNVTYCDGVRLTDPFLVRHSNLIWQVFKSVVNYRWLTIYLLNAYYDNRLPTKMVRIISTTQQEEYASTVQWHCLLWFDRLKRPILVSADYYSIWPSFWGIGSSNIFYPQLISCPVPSEYQDQAPRAVSLQSRGSCRLVEDDPSNVLRVKYNKRIVEFGAKENLSISVCMKAFRFGAFDISLRLVEWLEMVRLMGVEKVYFYEYSISENMRKVLAHYQEEGLVDLRRMVLPGTLPNIRRLYNLWASRESARFWPLELMELNDCLYRNIHRHDYIAILDVDEMIMPMSRDRNWIELIRTSMDTLETEDQPSVAYFGQHHARICETGTDTEWERISLSLLGGNGAHYRASIPQYLYMMRHTWREEHYPSLNNQKSFHRTAIVELVHNHFSLSCIDPTSPTTASNLSGIHQHCKGAVIDPNKSLLMHYRRNFEPPSNNPNCSIHDRTIWRYFELLEDKVHQQLNEIFG